MKKIRFAQLAIVSLMCAALFTGCPDTPDEETPDTSATLQEQIDNASSGGTVTLNSELTGSGTSIIISKALTVNGSGIEGLTVTVDSSVTDGVTLKNFKNATVKVSSVSSSRSARSAFRADEELPVTSDDAAELEGFKKFNDGALPLFLEDCTIEKFEASDDVALYLESGSKKSDITEIDLKEGAEGFTFIEDDKDVTDTDKSSVGKLYVEDGLKEINLIGGAFDDVDFADGITDEVKFKYDAEFEQFSAEKISELSDKSFLDVKDIALAENVAEENDSVIYKFEIPRDSFDTLNGYIDILFLTQAQRDSIATGQTGNLDYLQYMTYSTPAYDMSVMGPFAVEKGEDGTIANGLYAFYGASKTYYDYENSIFAASNGIYKVVTLEKYLAYSKEAVIAEVTDNKVTVYLNKGAVKKSDLLACTGYTVLDENGAPVVGVAEGGTKLSEIDLSGYTPYLSINTQVVWSQLFTDGNQEVAYVQGLVPEARLLSGTIVETPTGVIKSAIPRYYYSFCMEKGDSYPDVSDVVYPDIEVPVNKATVKYYDSSLTFKEEKTVIRENLNPVTDEYEYYLDSEFKTIINGSAADDNPVDWDSIYEKLDLEEGALITVYARPKRTVTFEGDGALPLALCELEWTDDGVYYWGEKVYVFTSYTESTGAYSGEITSPTQVTDNSTLYLVSPYVELVCVHPDDSSYTVSLGNYPVMLLKNMMVAQGEDQDPQLYVYPTTTLSEDDVLTPENLEELELGEKIYTPYPLVNVIDVATSGYDKVSELWFAELKMALEDSQNTVKYYIQSTIYSETGETVDKWEELTAKGLTEFMKSNRFSITFMQVSTSKPDTSEITVVNQTYDWSASTLKSQVVSEFDTSYKYYRFYKEEARTTELAKADVAALEAGSTVYLYSVRITIKDKNDEERYELPLCDIEGLPEGTKFYKDQSLETEYEYTEAELRALEEGAVIYADIPESTGSGE